ncbi:hypothetical protein RBU61_06460 [Tissierella sp. MB52-C2]|nr:hypothetical protein [Tissierella sp. MB52-C2]WMM26312.1 hypothetical protein RBU61_06460 [Tissierella sp. MB52-C2]
MTLTNIEDIFNRGINGTEGNIDMDIYSHSIWILHKKSKHF